MNVLEAHKQAKLEKMLDSLNLSPVNRAMCLDYLTGDTADDGLLKQAEPVNFVEMTVSMRQNIASYLARIRDAGNQEMVARFYKLFWAMGKGTAAFALEETGSFRPRREERSWCADVLGKAAVAAMEASEYTWHSMYWENNPWLNEIARTEPEVLEQAQSLSGTPHSNMAIALAGILLCNARESVLGKLLGGGLVRRQSELLLSGTRSFLMDACQCLTDPDRKLLLEYVQRGDMHAPVPAIAQSKFGNVNNMYISSDALLIGQLGCASFLGQRQSGQARCAVRVYAALNQTALLNRIFRAAPMEYLREELDHLAEDLPGGAADLLLYVSQYHVHSNLKNEIAKRFRAAVPKAMDRADASQYAALAQMFPECFNNADHGVEERLIAMLKKTLTTGGPELKAYMKAEGSLRHSRKQLENVSVPTYCYQVPIIKLMEEYRKQFGWNGFFCRCVVVQGLVFDGHGMGSVISGMWQVAESDLRKMIAELMDRELPVEDLLDILGACAANSYEDGVKKTVRDVAGSMLGVPAYLEGLCLAACKGNVMARQMAISALDDLTKDAACAERAKAGLLACAGDSAKQIREQLAAVFSGHPEWCGDYTAMLKSRKSAQRLLAVAVLAGMGEQTRPVLEEALAAEKSSKVADAIQSILGQSAIPQAAGDDLAGRILKGNKIRKIQWLLDQPLPELHRTDGGCVSEDQRAAILVAYGELGRIGRSDSAAELARDIDTADLAALAHEVFERWMNAGAQAKTKWVLPFAAVFGGASMTPKLIRAINDWPQHARGAIACDAVAALALSTDPAALLAVDAISRKFKFRQVKTAAAAALENAARELGITAEELADRIVPDLGFGADGKRIFDYGSRSFTVTLTPTLELEITNHLGKKVKNLPAPGKTDDAVKVAEAYEAFKSMKKQIRTTVTTQKARLEAALSSLRCWKSDAWQALFVRNPIMHQFAISLIWGVYEDGKLTDTFRYMEDGSFNTVDEDEYELPEGVSIGLVHPVDLDGDTLDGWKQQLEDYEIVQSIPQLNRPVYASDAEGRTLERFGGKMLNGLSLAGKLLGMGWYRGSVQDAGMYYTFYREDPGLGLGAELRFSGAYVGDENDTVTVYDAVFYKAGTVKRGSYVYDEPKEADLFDLQSIPARYYSEIVYQLERATASSTETNEDWKKDRG